MILNSQNEFTPFFPILFLYKTYSHYELSVQMAFTSGKAKWTAQCLAEDSQEARCLLWVV